MDREKQIEIIRKRNIELSKQIEDLQLRFDLNSQGYQSAKDLITDLENIRADWMEALTRLYDKEAEYQQLLSDIKEIRTNLQLCLAEILKPKKD